MKYRDFWVCLLLVTLTLTVYWRVQDYDFVNIDDDLYVSENKHIQEGVTKKSIIWAFNFSGKEDTYWHPLSWLSHALDCGLYGLQPGKHHLTNLIFHLANSVLLFMVFKWMTGAFWQSAFLAALFAIHPINVDTVAWITERKNVLSAFFWMLTMLGYVYYAGKPGFFRYLLTFLMYVMGLLSKPVLVTLPFVLLLLDFWPLRRLAGGGFIKDREAAPAEPALSPFKKIAPIQLIVEKIPFFILSGLTVWVSSLSIQDKVPLAVSPMGLRIANALVSYVKYMGNMIWPQGLTVLYPYPRAVPAWETIGASAFLICVSILAIRLVRTAPYFIVGLCWFLGTLVPVSGLIQVGLWPAMADRFAYVPLIGLFMVIAWGVPQICRNRRYCKAGLPASAALLLAILITVAWKQVGYWENSITLFERNLRFTSGNHIAHNNLGAAYNEKGRTKEAMEQYRLALQLRPDSAEAHNNLGLVLEKEDRTEEAIHHYLQALKLMPDSELIYRNAAVALDGMGRRAEAIENYFHALRIKPDFLEVHYKLGIALNNEGRTEEAIQHYLEALRIEPDFGEVHNNLGNILGSQGRIDEAVEHYIQAIKINPDLEEPHNNLGVALCKKGKIEEGLEQFRAALRINPDYGPAKENLRIVSMYQQQKR